MPPAGRLLTFALTAFLIILVPGPSVLFVISRALVLGRIGALLTVVGNAFGVYVQVMAVALGIGTIVERSILVFTTIKLGGAVYLIYLGVQAIRHRRRLASVLETTPRSSTLRRIAAEGFLVGLANPKSVVFFAAVLPQFVQRSAGAVPAQMLVLGAVFLVIALVSDGLWALAAGSARDWFARSPQRLARLGGTGGLIMIGMGTRLAITGRHD